MHRIKDVTLGSGLTKLKLKNAILETIKEFDKTTLFYIIPPFKKGTAYGQSNETEAKLGIYEKEKEQYFSTKTFLGGIEKALKKVVGLCPNAVEYAEGIQADRKKKSILSRLVGFSNGDVIIETLKLYDGCN